MVLEDTSGGWTATEVDPAVTSDVSLLEAANQTQFADRSTRPGGLVIQTALQTAAVIVAALAAGLLVFFVIRAAVGSDPGEEQAQDFNELPTVGLEPDDGDRDASTAVGSSRSGSKRDTLEDGIPEDEAVEEGSGTDDVTGERDSEPPAAIAATSDETNSDIGETGDGAEESTGNTDLGANVGSEPEVNPADPSPPTSGSPSQDQPDPTTATTAKPGTTTTTERSQTTSTQTTVTQTTTTDPSPTTQPTTVTTVATTATTPSTATTVTTLPATTTTTAPTASTVAGAPLIAAPIDGSVHTWETGVLFQANAITGAEKYCWTITSPGKTVEKCLSGTGFSLPGGEAGVNPGPVRVTAVAKDDGGAVLESQNMALNLVARDLLKDPSPGDEFEAGDSIRARFEDIPSATNYCITLSQGTVQLPTRCDNDDRVSVRIRRFSEGQIKIAAEVFRGQQSIGRQSIVVDYLG